MKKHAHIIQTALTLLVTIGGVLGYGDLRTTTQRAPAYDDNPPPQDAPAVEDGRFQWEENN